MAAHQEEEVLGKAYDARLTPFVGERGGDHPPDVVVGQRFEGQQERA